MTLCVIPAYSATNLECLWSLPRWRTRCNAVDAVNEFQCSEQGRSRCWLCREQGGEAALRTAWNLEREDAENCFLMSDDLQQT